MKSVIKLTGMAMLLLAVMQFGSFFAAAETVSFKSCLFWRADADSDFFLPEIPAGRYELKKSVPTDALVNTITVNWKFDGAVTMEISANGGKHYNKVVNGVPLVTGFVTGHRIRWRATLAQGSKLREVKISYTDSLGSIATFGEPELSGFRYRKLIHIKGSDRELYNYQVYIKIGESRKAGDYDVHCERNLEKDFDDIRFTAMDGETLLPYYREEITGFSPRRVGKFWVKIPQIPIEGISIYVYYGNAGAKDLSSDVDVLDVTDTSEGSVWGRKYAEVEPVVDTASLVAGTSLDRGLFGEEKVDLPVFNNTVLAPNGNVVIAQRGTSSRPAASRGITGEGSYTTKAFDAAFVARILVPSWEGTGVFVDVSADNGNSYKKDCISHSYCYASRREFVAGMEPKARVRLVNKKGNAELEKLDLDYAPGSVTVMTPNGKEVWQAGTTRDILWSALEYDFFYPMRLEYSIDGGRTYTDIERQTDNDGIYAWLIPDELVSREVIIRVSDAYDNNVNDVSDDAFYVKKFVHIFDIENSNK